MIGSAEFRPQAVHFPGPRPDVTLVGTAILASWTILPSIQKPSSTGLEPAGRTPRRMRAELIFAGGREPLRDVQGAGQAHARFVVVELDRLVLGECVGREEGLMRSAARLHRLHAKERGAGDLLGRRQVFLHQRRRHGQDAGDVVEAVTGHIGGKIIGRAGK